MQVRKVHTLKRVNILSFLCVYANCMFLNIQEDYDTYIQVFTLSHPL